MAQLIHQQGPLTTAQKKRILRAHDAGVPTKWICKQFNRSKETIKQVWEKRNAESKL